MHTPEQQKAILDYWKYQRRPAEPVAVESVVPTPAVVTWKPDETPIFIVSYPFYKFHDDQQLALLKVAKDFPEDETTKKFFPKGFAGHLGDFLAERNMLDQNNPEFANDVAIIARHCAISGRKSRKGETYSAVSEFTLNVKDIREENKETWSRLLQQTKNMLHYHYAKKCDLHRDITIPGID